MKTSLVVELKDGVQFCLKEEFRFYFEGLLSQELILSLKNVDNFTQENGGILKVPAGFYTDFGSIPLMFQSLISPVGKPSKAYVVHDYLIILSKSGLLKRKDVDLVFLAALQRQGVSGFKRMVLFCAVRFYGFVIRIIQMNLGLIISSMFGACALGLWFLYSSAVRENAELNSKLQLEITNKETLKEALNKQNEQIKALQVTKSSEPETIKEVEKIVLKDKSCESELQGYKNIFKELGK